jgi:phosphoribosyl 1,2-cyclic phosphodiesterase
MKHLRQLVSRMKVTILASGSSGNCIHLESKGAGILIDAGIPKTKIEKALIKHGIQPMSIDAIFVTHAHKDHVCGLQFANKYGIPVFATRGEWQYIKQEIDAKETIKAGQWVEVANYTKVFPFSTYHDATDPVGYVVIMDRVKCSILLDTGKYTDEMISTMFDSSIYIIEANHDKTLLVHGSYPQSLKERITSDYGHLSNKQTADLLGELVQGEGEKIYLTHLSEKNNNPLLAKSEVVLRLAKNSFYEGFHYQLEVI